MNSITSGDEKKPLATAQCQPAQSSHHPQPSTCIHNRRCQSREHQVRFDVKPLNAPVRDATCGHFLHRAVMWVRGLQGQVLHMHSGCCLPRWAEPRHGAGLSPADQGNMAGKTFCSRKPHFTQISKGDQHVSYS